MYTCSRRRRRWPKRERGRCETGATPSPSLVAPTAKDRGAPNHTEGHLRQDGSVEPSVTGSEAGGEHRFKKLKTDRKRPAGISGAVREGCSRMWMEERPSRKGRVWEQLLCLGCKELSETKPSADKRETSRWVSAYQAKTRGQEEPRDLHQGPWPIANHVLHVVIETIRP